jgi:hypothetical protein
MNLLDPPVSDSHARPSGRCLGTYCLENDSLETYCPGIPRNPLSRKPPCHHALNPLPR